MEVFIMNRRGIEPASAAGTLSQCLRMSTQLLAIVIMGFILVPSCRLTADATLPTEMPTGYVQVDFDMKNLTRYRGETVRLKCEITGDPIPRYRWYRDDQLIRGDSGRFRVQGALWGSKLRISNLRPEDSGAYTCEGFNQYAMRKITGQLHVYRETNPNKNNNNREDDTDDGDRDRNRDDGRDGPPEIEFADPELNIDLVHDTGTDPFKSTGLDPFGTGFDGSYGGSNNRPDQGGPPRG